MENNHVPHRESMSVIVKVLSVFGGVIASLCFVMAIIFSDVFRDPSVGLVLSIITIAGVVFLSRVVNPPFVQTVVISMYIAALSLFCYAMYDINVGHHVVCGFLLLIGGVTFWLCRGWVFKFIAVIVFNCALMAWILIWDNLRLINFVLLFYGVVLFLLGLYEGRVIRVIRDFRPLYVGFFISFLAGLAINAFVSAYVGRDFVLEFLLWGAIYAGLVYMVSRVMVVLEVESVGAKIVVYGLVVLLLVPTILAPYLLGVLMALLMSFYYGFRGESIISVVALCGALSRYYYVMETTLLVKSGVLVLTGVVLLVAWYFLNKTGSNVEKK